MKPLGAFNDRDEGMASERRLAWFGLSLATFFGILGGITAWRTGSLAVSWVVWGAGGMLVVLYYAVPSLRRPVFRAWSALTRPIGWLLTRFVLALVYYLVVTPVGLALRLAGHDPMRRRRDPGAHSYWSEREAQPEARRYFRQF